MNTLNKVNDLSRSVYDLIEKSDVTYKEAEMAIHELAVKLQKDMSCTKVHSVQEITTDE